MKRDDKAKTAGEPFSSFTGFPQDLVRVGRRTRVAPPAQLQWEHFAAKMSLVAGKLEPVSGVHTLPDNQALKSASNAAPPFERDPTPKVDEQPLRPESGTSTKTADFFDLGPVRATSASPLSALAWGALGALVGGALVFAWHERSSNQAGETPQRSSVITDGESNNTKLSGQQSPAKSDLLEDRPTNIQIENKSGHHLKKVSSRLSDAQDGSGRLPIDSLGEEVVAAQATRGVVVPSEPVEGSSKSSLPEEVKLLQHARRVSSAQALTLIASFHKRFPHSALGADAEVVALEALHRLGQFNELTKRAEQFLNRFPGDPHVQRVRSYLTER